MLVLVAILFCTLSLSFTFKFIVPSILKKVSKHTGRRIELNPIIVISVFLINSIISLWIYAQLVLIVSGESEQVRYNIYFIAQNFYPPNILEAIKLSFKYDAKSFIIQIIFHSILYLIVYLKIVRRVNKKILTSLFFISLFFTYVDIPLDIVKAHDEAVRLAKAEQERIAAEAILTKNTNIYLHFRAKVQFIKGNYSCLKRYEAYEAGDNSIPYVSLDECKNSEKLCLLVEKMDHNIKDEYKKELERDREECYSWYWREGIKYSKDFDLEE